LLTATKPIVLFFFYKLLFKIKFFSYFTQTAQGGFARRARLTGLHSFVNVISLFIHDVS